MAMCSRDGNRTVAVINEDSGASGASGGSIFFTKRSCYRALSGVSFQNSVSSGCSSSCGSGSSKWSPESSAPEAPRIFQRAGSTDEEEDEDFYEEDSGIPIPELTKVTKNSGMVRVTFIQQVNAEAPELSDESDLYESGSEIVALPEHIYDDVPPLPAVNNSGIHSADSSGAESEFSDKTDRAFIYRPPRPSGIRNSSGWMRNSGDKSLLERGKTFRERLKRPLRKLFDSAPPPPAIDYSGADENASALLPVMQITDYAPLSAQLPALPVLPHETNPTGSNPTSSANPEAHPHAEISPGRFNQYQLNELRPYPLT